MESSLLYNKSKTKLGKQIFVDFVSEHPHRAEGIVDSYKSEDVLRSVLIL